MTENKDKQSLSKANTLLGLQFLSDFGDQITSALLALIVLDITQSTEQVGLVYAFNIIGFVVFTLVGGMLGDVLERRRILCLSDIGRGLVVLLLIFAAHERSLVFIYLTSFLLSMFAALHGPVKLSFWAEAIPRNFLERYNSLSQLSLQSSSILGPLIASFFVLQNLASFGFFVDALTFFICALVFSRIVLGNYAITEKPTKRDFLQGIKIIFQSTDIKKYIAYDAYQMLGFGAFNATFLVLAQRDFGFSKAQYSMHLSIVAILTAVGALLGATRKVELVNPITKLTACAIFSGLALYLAIAIESFPISSVFVGICDALIVLTMAVARTKVQLIAKQEHPAHLSSIFAGRSVILKCATLLSVGICLLAADILTLETTLTLLIIPIALSFVPLVNRSDLSLTLSQIEK